MAWARSSEGGPKAGPTVVRKGAWLSAWARWSGAEEAVKKEPAVGSFDSRRAEPPGVRVRAAGEPTPDVRASGAEPVFATAKLAKSWAAGNEKSQVLEGRSSAVVRWVRAPELKPNDQDPPADCSGGGQGTTTTARAAGEGSMGPRLSAGGNSSCGHRFEPRHRGQRSRCCRTRSLRCPRRHRRRSCSARFGEAVASSVPLLSSVSLTLRRRE